MHAPKELSPPKQFKHTPLDKKALPALGSGVQQLEDPTTAGQIPNGISPSGSSSTLNHPSPNAIHELTTSMNSVDLSTPGSPERSMVGSSYGGGAGDAGVSSGMVGSPIFARRQRARKTSSAGGVSPDPLTVSIGSSGSPMNNHAPLVPPSPGGGGAHHPQSENNDSFRPGGIESVSSSCLTPGGAGGSSKAPSVNMYDILDPHVDGSTEVLTPPLGGSVGGGAIVPPALASGNSSGASTNSMAGLLPQALSNVAPPQALGHPHTGPLPHPAGGVLEPLPGDSASSSGGLSVIQSSGGGRAPSGLQPLQAEVLSPGARATLSTTSNSTPSSHGSPQHQMQQQQ